MYTLSLIVVTSSYWLILVRMPVEDYYRLLESQSVDEEQSNEARQRQERESTHQ